MKIANSDRQLPPATVPLDPRPKGSAAFSLIEIMVVVGLLSVIVLGLMAMFTQTQKAFRLGMAQTDVLESGRIATDMIVRELEQITPSYTQIYSNAPNFYADLLGFGNEFGSQRLPGGVLVRTNLMHDVFFVVRENQTWTGIGYFVRTNVTGPNDFGAVGSLYRFETNNNALQFAANPGGLFAGFNRARTGGSSVNVSKLLDGVIHFKVRAYETNGYRIVGDIPYWTSSNPTNIYSGRYPLVDESYYWFYSNAVPTTVDLELGILEQQTYEKYKSIPIYTAQTNFLADQAGHVQLFRQRIPIHNLDVSAYQ
jgi:hypothetical protein